MILAADVGNSHIVIGCIENDEIIAEIRLVTNKMATENEYAIKIRQILEFENIDYSNVEGSIISSVAPQVTVPLKRALKKLTGIDPIVVGAGIKTGLNIKLDDPGSLGADLVSGSVGAISKFGYPLIVLNMGTATTIAVIDKDGAYIGGAIVPGVQVSLNALTSEASLLQNVSISEPKKCIAQNTTDSIKSGSVYGTASMIDGMIDRMQKELGYTAKVIATGELVKSIIPCCNHEIECDENLLLDGLNILYKKNLKRKNLKELQRKTE